MIPAVLWDSGGVVNSWDLTDGMRFFELLGLMKPHIPRYFGLSIHTDIHSNYTNIHSPTIITHTCVSKCYFNGVLGPKKINMVLYMYSLCEHFSQVSLLGTWDLFPLKGTRTQ